MHRVRVRPLKSLEEFRACERIQRDIWGSVSVGSELLLITQKYGGVVLGALVDGRIAGLLCAFLARRQGRLIHWSHIMAVEARYRDRGLGLRMKSAHRRLALKQGIKSICWTFDPLQSRNAALGIFRLGARVEEYVPDCYGHYPSLIEKGLPTDRFVVNWLIASPAVERCLRRDLPRPQDLSLPPVNETRLDAQEFLENRRIRLDLREPRVLVEIPANTDNMRAYAFSLARRWRMETREIFQRYLAAGYTVKDFLPLRTATRRRCFYLLGRPATHC